MMPHRTTNRWPLALPCFLLASCVPAPKAVEAPPAPPPVLAVPPAPPSSPDWRDWPLTPGTWTYRAGTASFGRPGVAPDLELRCDAAARQIVVARAAPPAAAPRAIAITTTDSARSLPASDGGGATRAALAAGDPFLDRMAFSRGRLLVTVEGTTRLVVPAWAEIGRVVEDCRG